MSTAYEHVNGVYGGCLENQETLYSEEILRIPSAINGTATQFRIWARNLITYLGFSIYACQMSHTSKGGL